MFELAIFLGFLLVSTGIFLFLSARDLKKTEKALSDKSIEYRNLVKRHNALSREFEQYKKNHPH